MNKKQLSEMKDAVGMMARHVRGEHVAGMRITEIRDSDVKVIREGANVSQSEFACLVGVKLRTLQNWKQHRSRPTGPARALFKIVASNPKSAIKALHG